MTRVTHSNSGFLRYIQMSDKDLFTFVEGKTHDQYFYDRVCDAACSQAGVSYEQIVANDLPGATGGKNAALAFYRYLRRRHFLAGSFKGSKKVCVFFLDKDIDDLLRKTARSNHVIYTEFYDVENHLFVEGDLTDSAAAAASLSKQLVGAGLGPPSAWRRSMADLWKDWVKLCILVRKRGLNCRCNYRLASRINTPLDGPLDKTALAMEMKVIRAATGLTRRKFTLLFERVSAIVENLYTNGHHDRVFKGKWYVTLLELQMRRIAAGRRYDANGLGDRVSHAIMMTIDYRGRACEHFKAPLRLLMKPLMLRRRRRAVL